MDEEINNKDLLLDVECIREGFRCLTQTQNDNLASKRQLDKYSLDNAWLEVMLKGSQV